MASSASVPSVTQSVSYSYDSAGRLQTIASPVSTARYRYGATGLLTEVRRYLDSAAAAADADYSLPASHPSLLLSANTYQPFGYGVLSKTNRVGDTVVSKFGYTLNDLGQRTAMINTGTAFAQPSQYQYRYNEKGEVIAGNRYEGADPLNPGPAIPSDTFAYRFDDIGNRLTATRGASAAPLQKEDYTANLLNQYTKIDTSVLSSPSVPSVTQSVSPVHDADGNLVSDTRWHYIWNAENRLIELETSPAAIAAGAPKQKLLFAYDYQGRRTSKQVFLWNLSLGTWNLSADTRFLYDGWNLVAEFSVQGSEFNVQRSYVWGLDMSGSLQGAGGVGGLLTVSTHNPSPLLDHPSSIAHLPFFDANGNVSEYLDSTGAIAAHFEYSPFGETLRAQISNPEIADLPFRFSTKYTDSETGHLYYGYRYYDTSTGRWLSRDPIEEEGGVNLYGMLGNDASNRVDPIGLADLPIQDHHPVSPYQKILSNHPLVKRAGVRLDLDQQLVTLENHAGRHSASYHAEVRNRLDAAWKTLGSKPTPGAARGAFSNVVDGIIEDIRNGKLKPYDGKEVRFVCLPKFTKLLDKVAFLGCVAAGLQLFTAPEAKAQNLARIAVEISQGDEFAEVELITAATDLGGALGKLIGMNAYGQLDATMAKARKLAGVELLDLNNMKDEERILTGEKPEEQMKKIKPFTGQKENIIVGPNGKTYIVVDGKLKPVD